ncbi:MaoC family dehydratase [Acuticoccus sediminis]|uniref:MaoC family dehydratase n=1 Tax=Acuticoccus sediminis TaxID=2184697 RepID=UPI001391F21E|nr:MaoC family dehydratase [Acuticoccus sediminis]
MAQTDRAVFFEDYERLGVGHCWVTGARRVGADDIRAFAAATRDFNPIHLDPAHARRSGFGDVIAHGYMTVAWAAGLVHDMGLDQVASNAILQSNWRFTGVVEAGASIHVELVVEAMRPSKSNADFGVVTRRFDILTDDGRRVADGTVTIQVFRRAAAQSRGLLTASA